jgi:hypothetical protein
MPPNPDTITCKYLPYSFGDKFIFLPLIHIYVKAEGEMETVALVDSGATRTFIPYEIADAIGLLPEDRRDRDNLSKGETRAAAGTFNTYIVKLPMLRAIKGTHTFDEFRNIDVHVPQTEDIALPHAILGRDHLFKRFDITFQERRQKVTFLRR